MRPSSSGPTAVLAACLLARTCRAGYALQDDYSAEHFLSGFEFYTGPDPTNGFVKYASQASATADLLVGQVNNGSIYIGTDSTNVTPQGRPSVRVSSHKSYNHGLLIADIGYMPGGACGSWPALWLLADPAKYTWPAGGEIDIVEGVNQQSVNAMTLHTSSGCSISAPSAGSFTGNVSTSNCDINASGQSKNAGCTVGAPPSSTNNTFGIGFNANGGGVYATEWTSQAISIWFFPRGTVPENVAGGSPDPTTWGAPVARFAGHCDIDSHFKDMKIIINTAFCGDWAGKVWESGGCAASTGVATCQEYVANHPRAFSDAYWEFRSLRMFQTAKSEVIATTPSRAALTDTASRKSSRNGTDTEV